MKPNDEAFPYSIGSPNEEGHYSADGLTKRQYFAAHAMSAVFSRGDFAHLTIQDRAIIAVRIADAMVLALNAPRDLPKEVPPWPIAD
jgi:hypothetical protein